MFAARYDNKVAEFKDQCEATSWDSYQQYVTSVAEFVKMIELMLADCDKQVDEAFEHER